MLNGGEGNDTFRYASVAEANGDRITDFAAGDRIVVDGMQKIGEGSKVVWR